MVEAEEMRPGQITDEEVKKLVAQDGIKEYCMIRNDGKIEGAWYKVDEHKGWISGLDLSRVQVFTNYFHAYAATRHAKKWALLLKLKR